MIEIVIPKMGMSTVEVDILEWFVQAGDHIVPGEPLVEVESEKSTFIIQAEVAGKIHEICLQAGDSARVGDVVCRVQPD
ncbi:MAG: hypothetical protein K6T83_06545 [Alicyclobacillus sp.]|nr:hypothetical protein [Alicyclobacillus sp.]